GDGAAAGDRGVGRPVLQAAQPAPVARRRGPRRRHRQRWQPRRARDRARTAEPVQPGRTAGPRRRTGPAGRPRRAGRARAFRRIAAPVPPHLRTAAGWPDTARRALTGAGMPSQWSSTDRVRRWVFLAAMGVVGLLLAYVAYGILHGRPAAAPAPSPTTRPPRPASPRATDSPVPVPSGHEQDDSQAEPSPRRSQGPLRVPPRYDTAPALPLTEADLTAARDRALTFLEVFANGRWDDRPDDKITKLRQFVPPASIDVVLAAYDR